MIDDVRAYFNRGMSAEENWNLPYALEQYSHAVDEAMQMRLDGYSRSPELNALLALALERLAGVLVESSRIDDGLAHLDLARDLVAELGADAEALDRIAAKRARYQSYRKT